MTVSELKALLNESNFRGDYTIEVFVQLHDAQMDFNDGKFTIVRGDQQPTLF